MLDYCLNADETISMPTSGLFTNQRLANIYDGPSYQDSNAFLDISGNIWRLPLTPTPSRETVGGEGADLRRGRAAAGICRDFPRCRCHA